MKINWNDGTNAWLPQLRTSRATRHHTEEPLRLSEGLHERSNVLSITTQKHSNPKQQQQHININTFFLFLSQQHTLLPLFYFP